MTKEQLKSKLESIRAEINSMYMDNGVRTDTGLYYRLLDAEYFVMQAISSVYEYQESDGGQDHETGI